MLEGTVVTPNVMLWYSIKFYHLRCGGDGGRGVSLPSWITWLKATLQNKLLNPEQIFFISNAATVWFKSKFVLNRLTLVGGAPSVCSPSKLRIQTRHVCFTSAEMHIQNNIIASKIIQYCSDLTVRRQLAHVHQSHWGQYRVACSPYYIGQQCKAVAFG